MPNHVPPEDPRHVRFQASLGGRIRRARMSPAARKANASLAARTRWGRVRAAALRRCRECNADLAEYTIGRVLCGACTDEIEAYEGVGATGIVRTTPDPTPGAGGAL